MRAKLYGFIERPDAVARRYPVSDTSLPARYGPRHLRVPLLRSTRRARANRCADPDAAEQSLLPTNSRARRSWRSGRPADAIAPLRQAVAHAPNPALIQISCWDKRSSPANDRRAADESDIDSCRRRLSREPESPDGYMQLAMAYGHKNDLARADLASAQAAFLRGDMKTAREIAARAKTRFPVGSPGWVKADDIASYKAGAELLFPQLTTEDERR